MVCQFESRRNELRDNLIRLYADASDTVRTNGLAWYPRARGIVNTWAKQYGLSRSSVACIVAALSPQVDWAHNLKLAHTLLTGGIPRGLYRNIAKAQAIHREALAHGPTWQAHTMMYELFPCGPKVNSFAYNLAGNNTAVTVDGHALQAALNDVLSTITIKWTPYRIIAECYAHAAHDVGLRPAPFQAITWLAWKEHYPTEHKKRLRRQW